MELKITFDGKAGSGKTYYLGMVAAMLKNIGMEEDKDFTIDFREMKDNKESILIKDVYVKRRKQ